MTVILFVLGIVILYFLAAVNIVALVYSMIGLIDPGRSIKATYLYCFFAGLFWPVVGIVLVIEASRKKKDKSISENDQKVIDIERERMVREYGDRLDKILNPKNDSDANS